MVPRGFIDVYQKDFAVLRLLWFLSTEEQYLFSGMYKRKGKTPGLRRKISASSHPKSIYIREKKTV